MKIITSNPVLQDQNFSPSEFYYNQEGPYSSEYLAQQSSSIPFSNEYIASQQKKGLTWDKVKGAWTKAQESGLIDKGKELLGGLFGKKPKSKPAPVSTSGGGGGKGSGRTQQGMSDTTKLLIGVGVVAVLGFVIYKASKGNK